MLEACAWLLGAVSLLVITPRRMIGVVLCAYFVRVVLSYVHVYLFVLPDSQFDAIRFERVAWEWAGDRRCLSDFTTGSLLYSWIGSCIYSVFGRSALLLQLVNAYFGTIVVFMTMRIAALVEPDSKGYKRVGWVVAFYPSMVLYSAITMREVAVVFPFIVSVYWIVKWSVNKDYRCAVRAIVWMLVSQLFHTGMITGTVMVVSIVVYSVITRHWPSWMTIRVRKSDLTSAVAAAMMVVVIAALALWVIATGYGLDKLGRLETQGLFEALVGWQENVARGRARYLDDWTSDRIFVFLLQLPVRFLYFMGAPFIWDVSLLHDFWGFVDGTFLLILGFQIVRNTGNRVWRQRGRLLVAVIVFVMILGFSTVTSNYGTAFRHRAKFVPVLIVLCVSQVRRRSNALWKSELDPEIRRPMEAQ